MLTQTPISAPDLPDVDDFISPKIIGLERGDPIYEGLRVSGILDHLAFCSRGARSFWVGGIHVDITQIMPSTCLIQSVVHTKLHYKNWYYHFHCAPHILADLVSCWLALGQASMYEIPESWLHDVPETRHEFTFHTP